ncbi:MAG: hypothetical protein UY19_C0003G0070, partial [Candidatus Wolfebacteria bacterium GW2011_GWA2_47_9b]
RHSFAGPLLKSLPRSMMRNNAAKIGGAEAIPSGVAPAYQEVNFH